MDRSFLGIAQMLEGHPIFKENNSYRMKYIQTLEYFVRKYSPDDEWANACLRLYKKELLDGSASYHYENFCFQSQVKGLISTKFRPFKFFTYRYCLIFDCILF
ncbi:MAG: hypothetical protein LIO67_02435, partial [Lachnospiraceae bacterium]|nr:hypothetical protein [Lachnospiraceae bacterium]